MQTTVKTSVQFYGKGLHTGEPVSMVVQPAPVDYGIRFFRTDVQDEDNQVPARYDCVVETLLSTTLANRSGVSVKTVEHVMAGLAACGIHNARVELDGPEAPIMDGSALPFARKFLDAGTVILDAAVRVMKIKQRVSVCRDGCSATLEPADGSEMEFEIAFPDPIGSQECVLNLANGSIVRHLIDCRTFCLKSQISKILKQGIGLGGDVRKNVLVADDILNKYVGKSRRVDECVRHKMLDAVGDLALAGFPVIGKFKGVRSGHSVTNELLRKLFKTPEAYAIVEADQVTASYLPGAGASSSDIPVLG